MSAGSRDRRLRSRLVAALCVTAMALFAGSCADDAAAAPISFVPVPDRTLWVGDIETGDLSQFQTAPWNLVGGIPPAIVEAPVRDGRYAVALGIGGMSKASDGICCGSRNELLPAFRDLVSGDDLYFRFSTYLEPGFPVEAEWQSITQFKQNFDGSPPLALYVEQGQYRLEGGYGYPTGPRPFNLQLAAATTGRWVDWVLHVKFSSDPSVGYVEIWQDGKLILPHYAPATGTMYPGPNGVDGSYLKIGYYRDSAIATPGTVVYDDWRIGTTLAAVEG
ncbi:polysaccharide lyase [Pseudonocardia sp. GCM10023141]|uniref:polysaccharide lyase n=1 Tax=Pseudonocardia sp. GCM10023141 TaxID=3252653 RepID=UPI0036082EBC